MDKITPEQVVVTIISAQHNANCTHAHPELRSSSLANRLALARAIGPERALAALRIDPSSVREELRAIQMGQALVSVEGDPR